MSKRYYLCDIIGDGSIDNPYRAAVSDLGVNHVAVFPPQDPNTGQYARPHCLVLVGTPNQRSVSNSPHVDDLPDFPLDGKVQAIEQASRQRAAAALQRRGFATGHLDNKDGYRDVIRSVGLELDNNFDEENFDVSE